MALHLCGSCSRHIRSTEASCPFCGATDARRTGHSPLSRATRAAMVFGAAAAVATAAVACGGATTGDGTDDGTTLTPAYGAPAFDAATDSADPAPVEAGPRDAGRDTSAVAAYGSPPDANIQPPYGSPPPFDSGAD